MHLIVLYRQLGTYYRARLRALPPVRMMPRGWDVNGCSHGLPAVLIALW
jgi:hypothetical protein